MTRKPHRPPISAVLLVHQYSELVEAVVQAVTWCDEIIMVLSEPHQELEDLAKRVSAKCFFRKFDNYGPQKQFAVSKASHDWILNIDSDEWVSPELQNQIQSLFATDEVRKFSAFRIRQKFIFLGRPLQFCGTRATPIRLFNRTQGQMGTSIVHEDFETPNPIGFLKAPLHHTSYVSLDDYFFKFNKYTSLAAETLYKKGKKTNLLLIWGRFPLLFLRRYIFQLGILDGHNGFIWCWLSAWYSTVKYLKLHELWQKSSLRQ